MTLDVFHIDAFTETLFQGNPACVVPLEGWLSDRIMLDIARENAVAETAFIVSNGDSYDLRWFTPDMEMDLCGHATLAAAHAVRSIMKAGGDRIVFNTVSGVLVVEVSGERYTLDFPARPPEETASLPDELIPSLSIRPLRTLLAERDYVLVYGSENDIRNIVVDRNLFDIMDMGQGGVAVTAPGDGCDFVSRFFTPRATILEDFVTGSAHCSLIPYWSGVLSKKELTARQISARPGTLYCTDAGDRVLIAGDAVTYSIGNIFI